MIKNFIYFLIPSLLQIIISILIVVPITTYYLEPSDFGVIALLFAITLPVSIITSAPDWVLGGNYLQSDKYSQKVLVFNIMFIDFLLRTSLVIIFWVFGDNIITAFNIDTYENIYSLYNLVLIGIWFALFWTTVSKLLIITGRGRYHFIWDTSKFLIGVFVTIISISYFKMGVISIIYGFIASNLYSVIFELLYLRKNIAISFSNLWFKKILTFVYLSLPLNLSSALQPLVVRTSIQSYLGLFSLGIFSHAEVYSNAFKFTVKSAAHAVTQASITGYNNNDFKSISHIEQLLKILFILLNLVGFLIILFIGDIINLLTHGKFNQSADLVPLLYMLLFSNFYGIMPTQSLIAKSKKNILFLSEFIFTILSAVIILLTIDTLGLKGVVVTILISNICCQLCKRIASARLGYSSNIDSFFWIGIASYLMFYFTLDNLDLNLLYRLIISILIVLLLLLISFKNFTLILELFKNKELNI